MAGTLYLCATPIGNLEDMTFRAVRILKEADLIAAEDTRNSIKLLNHFEIKTPMTSYHEYNKIEKGHKLVERLQNGEDIAVITDAGMPGISDPGEELVKMCQEAGITVTAVPGACACVTALTISGLGTRRFAFEAFLPTDKKERQVVLNELKDETRTMVIYEAPHRLVRTLKTPLVHIPTTAVLSAAKSARVWMRASKPAISSSTLSSRPNMEAMVAAFWRTLSTTPSSVSVARYTTGAISLRAS